MSKCKHISIDKEVCYVRFGEGEIHNSGGEPWITVAGDLMVFDFDKDGKVIGIELLSNNKPCQK